jgi:hypothetical protein
MKKLFLVEKQYVFNLLNRMTLVDEHSDCIVTNSIGFWRYKLKNINIKDVPYTEQPNEWSLTSVMPVYLGYPNISFLPEKSSIEMLLDELRLRWITYDEVIVITHQAIGCWSAHQLIKRMSGHQNIYHIRAEQPLTEIGLMNAFLSREKWGDNRTVANSIAFANRSLFFDYWWNVNSLKVFGDLFAMIGLEKQKVFTKFELMAFLVISKKVENKKVNAIINELVNWTGSGKYKFDALQNRTGKFWGNELQKLIDRKIIDITESNDLLLTTKGNLLVSYIHKQTYDPDLPYRLYIWCQNNEVQKMKQYIRQIFGRQHRFQKKVKTETKE